MQLLFEAKYKLSANVRHFRHGRRVSLLFSSFVVKRNHSVNVHNKNECVFSYEEYAAVADNLKFSREHEPQDKKRQIIHYKQCNQ